MTRSKLQLSRLRDLETALPLCGLPQAEGWGAGRGRYLSSDSCVSFLLSRCPETAVRQEVVW